MKVTSRKAWTGMLCAAMAVTSLTGCAGQDAAKQEVGDGSNKTIGIAMPTKDLERWNRDGAYLKEEFEKEGYKVKLVYSEYDSEKQAEDIEKLIVKNVDLLIVAAIDCSSLSTALADAKSAQIPVISYDRLIQNTNAISYYVSFDNYQVGRLQGEYIVDALQLKQAGKATYNLEIAAGDMADSNASVFYEGAMDVLQEYIDAGTLVIPSGQQALKDVATSQWDTSAAIDRMQNLLAFYYADGKTRLDACLCSNDSVALGVTRAIQSDYHGKNTPIITGQDGDEENLKNILSGEQSMTVFKALQNEAVVTLALAKEILREKRPAGELASAVDCEVKYDTQSYDNGVLTVPSYLLTPEVVTKDNYKEVLVDTGYYTEQSDGSLKAAVK